jgi:hypothetical protein
MAGPPLATVYENTGKNEMKIIREITNSVLSGFLKGTDLLVIMITPGQLLLYRDT